jgi:predicted O-linked N-acetylglucosamine transferase (SPINDLY family)
MRSSKLHSESSEQEIKETFQQALSYHQNGQLAEAKDLYSEIIEINPKHSNSLHFLGVLAYQQQDFQNSVELINRAIAINPNSASFYSNLGVTLMELKQFDSALDSYSQAVELKPDNADFHYNLANVLKELKDFKAAIISYGKAIALNPNNANYYCNRADLLRQVKQFDLAINDYDKALQLNPDSETYLNYGNVLFEKNDFESSISCYQKAIQLNPNYAPAYLNFANALVNIKQIDDAIINYQRAIELKPDSAEAYFNLGSLFVENRQFNLALSNYQKAFELKSNYKFLLGTLLHTKNKICDWRDYDKDQVELKRRIRALELVSSPFPVLSIIDSPDLQHIAAQLYVKSEYDIINNFGPIPKRLKGDKIRIGYYSADFHNHPVAYLSSDLFASHDRSKFELIGFSFGPDIDDEMRRKVKGSFDQFIDVRLKSDLEVTKLSRDMGIDIAVDLHGFTQNMRLNIFAARCAPIQVNYIGYPGTMGASYMDYLMTDKVMVPTKSYGHYSEKIVSLPDIYLVNCNRAMSDKVFTREEFGLPNDGFVYCCFNNSHKITPAVFDVWMRILKSVEGSVLWLFVDNAVAIANLRKEAERRGVSADRIIIADRLPMPEHLARHKLADLFLDTLPYTAHTTCSDALWAGLPVLTLIGESYPARVSAAILNSMGLPDLITNTQEEYEFKAIEFGNDADKLWEIRERLSKNKLTSPVYDVKKMTKSVEAAYEAMYDRYCNDLLPDNIEIKN